MKHLLPYLIISAGLFVYGCLGMMQRFNRWTIITALQMMFSGIVLAFSALTQIGHPGQTTSGLALILIIINLTILIFIAIIFTYRISKDEHTDAGST
jgi:NADH:ubiquinone oxidoreductase subunit K